MNKPFAIGRRWRGTKTDGRCKVDFVIVGPGSTEFHSAATAKSYKRCRIECRSKALHGVDRGCCDGMEQDYSHTHLKKYAVLVEEVTS